MKQRMETSKKVLLCTGLIFAVVVAVCVGVFVYCTISGVVYDWTGMVTLISISGGVFGTSIAAYFNKASRENLLKIKIGFLQRKYDILKEIGILDYFSARSELENEINQIDNCANTMEEATTAEITHQQIM